MARLLFILSMCVSDMGYTARILRPLWSELPPNHDVVLEFQTGRTVDVLVTKRHWVREYFSLEFGLGLRGVHRGLIVSNFKAQIPNSTPFWPWIQGQVGGVVKSSREVEFYQNASVGGLIHTSRDMELWIAKGVSHVWFGLRYRV